MIKKIFLLGNPNVGKSVVFSRLTGVQVISSNYPGTTVEIAKGFLESAAGAVEVIDLPGTYSLDAASAAEEVAVSLLTEQAREESLVIDIVDATNLERNLYLTLQLLERGVRVLVCLNMCDDTIHRGIKIDEKKLEQLLGVPVIPTCAVTGAGVKFLLQRLPDAVAVARPPATHVERWSQIGEIIEQVQVLSHRHHTLREIIEDASVKPFSGLLMGAVVISAAFSLVRLIGEGLIQYVADPVFEHLYRPFVERISLILGPESFLHHVFIGDLIDGTIDFKQAMGVLTTAPYIEFAMVLPYVFAFYLILSLLEDIGYLPRLALVLDSFLHRLGLHGFAIIPVLLGFGCNVPGILATRSLESARERFIASTLISIGVPCVALQAMIIALLGGYSGWYVAGVYLVLFVIWLVLGMILNRTVKGPSPELLLEIPPYRFPPLGMLAKKMFLRIKGFVIEAVPVVLAGVLAVNLLLYSNLLGLFSAIFSPLVKGVFGLPQETVIALLVGFVRKDVAAGMLVPLGLTVKQMFIAATLLAISFPCIATFAVMLKELGWKALVKATLIMIVTGTVVGGILNLLLRG